MGGLTRRTALGALAVGLAGAGGACGRTAPKQAVEQPEQVLGVPRPPAVPRPRVPKPHLLAAENAHHGSDAWQLTGRRAADDVILGVKGYASHASVAPGEQLSFHVTVAQREDFGIDLYRVGAYAGAGARLVHSSPRLKGVRQTAPTAEAGTGLISCGWEHSWTVSVPENWVSGFYLAVFTTQSGWRSYTAFVVRDGRPAELCVVLPFSTYQAYNQWPYDGSTGKSLYNGFDLAEESYVQRAVKVGADRPFDRTGMPKLAEVDMAFASWAESAGYDVTYASSEDLHSGRLDPANYRGLVFSGHDEYWTPQMRERAERAVADGTGLAFLSANNAYWRMRYEQDDRVVACYKSDPDPQGGPQAATLRWRDAGPNPARPEQSLLGVMYNGIVDVPAPLVVRESGHWLWKGTGVRDGDRINGVVRGEADGFDETVAAAAGDQVLLSASPYRRRGDGRTILQNTSVLRAPSGATVFAAGSLTWSRGLWGRGTADPRVRQATANVLDQIISH